MTLSGRSTLITEQSKGSHIMIWNARRRQQHILNHLLDIIQRELQLLGYGVFPTLLSNDSHNNSGVIVTVVGSVVVRHVQVTHSKCNSWTVFRGNFQ